MEATGIRSQCVTLLIDGPEDADPWGREALYDRDTKIGRLTSGGYSVAFGKSIGMGYVKPALAAPGTKLKVKMQDRLWDCEVTEDSPYDPRQRHDPQGRLTRITLRRSRQGTGRTDHCAVARQNGNRSCLETDERDINPTMEYFGKIPDSRPS